MRRPAFTTTTKRPATSRRDGWKIRRENGYSRTSCKRFEEMIRATRYAETTDDVPLGAFHQENMHGMYLVWFVSAELAKVIRDYRPKLKGFILSN